MRNTRKSIWKDRVFLSLMAVCLLAVVFVSANIIGNRGTDQKIKDTEETTSIHEEEQAADSSLNAVEGDNGKVLVDRGTDGTEDGVKVAAEVTKEHNYGKETGELSAEEADGTDSSKSDTSGEETESVGAEVAEAETPEESAEDASALVTQQNILHYDGTTSLVWPIEGELLREFAMDHTVYHATLQQYKVSPCILIQAEVGSHVTTPAVGLVQELGWNEEIGNFLRIDLGNSYQVIIGQLENITVQAGQYVAPGNILGTVAAPTKYYSVEGPNVYFQLSKDGVAADPTEYLE